MGFFSWLTILLIALKLLGIITWSWWLVLLPLYWVVAVIVIGTVGATAIWQARVRWLRREPSPFK